MALPLAVPAMAQVSAPDDLTTMPAVSDDYRPATTAWGDPDLRGTWPLNDIADLPVNRPDRFGDRFWKTPEEIAAEQAKLAAGEMEIDAKGAFVTPGFIDSHNHLASMALSKLGVNVAGIVGRDAVTGTDILATDPIADDGAKVGTGAGYGHGYGPHSLIEPPLASPAAGDPYRTAKLAIEEQKFANKAGLYIRVVVSATNVATINPALNDPTRINQGAVNNAVNAWNTLQTTTIPNLVTGAQKLAGATDYTSNLGTDYTFREGKLKGGGLVATAGGDQPAQEPGAAGGSIFSGLPARFASTSSQFSTRTWKS